MDICSTEIENIYKPDDKRGIIENKTIQNPESGQTPTVNKMSMQWLE